MRKFVLLMSGIYKEVTAITNKLKKLHSKYRQEKDKLKKSGTSQPKRMWKFLDKMDGIYKENPSVNPPFLIDSSKDENPHDQSSTSDEGADDGENENEDVGVCFLCISLILTFGIRILYCNAAVYF